MIPINKSNSAFLDGLCTKTAEHPIQEKELLDDLVDYANEVRNSSIGLFRKIPNIEDADIKDQMDHWMGKMLHQMRKIKRAFDLKVNP
jgi:hypothetical protein